MLDESICFFSLYLGINGDIFSNAEENSELSNLQSKLVFFYSPLACAFDHAVDLCLKYKIDGRTTASVCNVHCLKVSPVYIEIHVILVSVAKYVRFTEEYKFNRWCQCILSILRNFRLLVQSDNLSPTGCSYR